jgi:hypothetical protein
VTGKIAVKLLNADLLSPQKNPQHPEIENQDRADEQRKSTDVT